MNGAVREKHPRGSSWVAPSISFSTRSAKENTYFFSSLRSETVGDSAAGRRCLWNHFVMSRRSPGVGKSCPKGLEKPGQLLLCN